MAEPFALIDIYTAEFLQDLFLEFDFDPAEQIIVQRELNNSAECWHGSLYDENPIEHAHDLQKKLGKISRLSDNLRAQIANIPQNTWTSLFEYTEALQPDTVRLAFEGDGSSYYDLVTHPAHGSWRESSIDLGELEGFLWSLNQATSHMKTGLSFEKKFSRKDYKLHNWIRQIRTMWEQQLGRRFTRDALNSGEPVSEAARFCVKTYRVLDPETRHTRVLDAMKAYIKFMRECRLEEKQKRRD